MIYALYSDGATYRVLYDAAERKTYLATTTGGKVEVPYTVNGASFIRFDFSYVPEKGLRHTDIYDNRARFRKAISLLTPPAKPADYVPPPTPATEDNMRLHVEGQGFRALQEAVAKERLRNEAERASARREALAAANPTDPQKTQKARDINNALAQRWHTHREIIPPPVLSKENIGVLAEEARWRKRKIESES